MILAIIRVALVLISIFGICTFGIVYCLFCFGKLHRVSILSHLFGSMSRIFGIRVEKRNFSDNSFPKTCIYIANHQNNYDMVTVSSVVQPKTVTIGKKSLLWIPFFGQLYWLSGNLLIDRSYSVKNFRNILLKIIETIQIRDISVWVFPEGTRNYGKKLLPFKTGAFYAAVVTKVPIVPVCVSNLSNKIKLNRWSNGLVIIELMPPISTEKCDINQVRKLAAYCHKIMQIKIENLNQEVIFRENETM